MMRAADFRLRLDAASFYATRFAATMVRDTLPFEFRYCAVLNSSCDSNREADEIVYPEDDNVFHEDLEAKEVVELLCRNQRVPQWIDIAVGFSGRHHSHMSLLCGGRYHAEDNRLYYFDQGTQPFGIKSPTLPPRYKDGTRFRLPQERDFFERLHKLHDKTNEAEQNVGGQPASRPESK
ncbi:hypothetical protein FEM03_22295 [Phragmitibacter flavus]|uniref:Uncharacterized protein n=1 Tax=Phragmitibacter flavus TaxID=2576071 RepID=A0A5R8K870_9BACT|nr:hypothetical protein [Phragmitibacter flavus]TLD68538.1 hypothetical protein FEM03_22295 [Phragmitibacter flavus]